MKAISLWQPWASAIALGLKRYETRSWAPLSKTLAAGELLAIHAAKRRTAEERACFDETLADCHASRAAFADSLSLDFNILPFGAVVCVAEFNGVFRTETLAPSPLEQRWGNFSPARYGWHLWKVWALKTPFPCTGRQALFSVELPADWRGHATEALPFIV